MGSAKLMLGRLGRPGSDGSPGRESEGKLSDGSGRLTEMGIAKAMLGKLGNPGSDGRPGRLTDGSESETSGSAMGRETGNEIVGSDGSPGSDGNPGSSSDGKPHDIEHLVCVARRAHSARTGGFFDFVRPNRLGTAGEHRENTRRTPRESEGKPVTSGHVRSREVTRSPGCVTVGPNQSRPVTRGRGHVTPTGRKPW